MRLLHGNIHLLHYFLRNGFLLIGNQATGVNDLKLLSVLTGNLKDSVTGNSDFVSHDCLACTSQPIEQGGFTNVRPSYYGNTIHEIAPALESIDELLKAAKINQR